MKTAADLDAEAALWAPGASVTPIRPDVHVPDPEPAELNSEAGIEHSVPLRRLVPLRASDVEMKRVRWIMPDWLVMGGLNLLAGREGLGKSTLAVSIAASVTRGSLEGELFGKPRTVVYLATEDDPSFTITPRLLAAGADLDKILFLSVHTLTSLEGVVSLPTDLPELERVIAEFDVALVVLDAATSVMDARLDGHDDRKVRQFLEPLSQSAGRLDYTVLGLCHFGKRESADTGKLILGSLAWSQVARSVLAVAREDDTGRLVITNTKSNLATRTRSLAAIVESATVPTADGPTGVGVVRWLGDTDDDARNLLNQNESEDSADVDTWLRNYLEDGGGSRESKDIFAGADANGFSRDQTKRAKKRLGIEGSKVGNGPWLWVFPAPLPPSDH